MNIYQYTNYRSFLTDYYEHEKKKNPHFSYQYFANKAGITNKGFVYNIFKGKKNLSKSSILKFTKVIKFTPQELRYFENLVFFNQAKSLDEQNHYYKLMDQIKSENDIGSTIVQLQEDQYEYYSNWYNKAIRSLIGLCEFTGDFKWLARNIYPPITVTQAENSIKLLLKLELIEQNDEGRYILKNKSITSGSDFPEVIRLGVLNHHLETMKLAARAIKELPRTERNISGMVLGISEKTYNNICDELTQFRARIAKMAEEDNDADRVYQLNFHFYPMSNQKRKRPS